MASSLMARDRGESPAARDARAPEPVIHARPIDIDRIDADAIKVIRRLTRAGHMAYLVGGGVRDLLLDRKPKDFDIATSARPNEVRALFRNCRVIGRRFRLAHVLFGEGKVIEVATFRRDPRPDTADENGEAVAQEDPQGMIREDNVFGSPHEDANRRDFTINGLFYDIERSEVIDYVGGMPDLEAHLVRTIRAPAGRLREDPVRILRAVKFSARLDMGIDSELYDAMVDQRHSIELAAKPRVFEEILRFLRGGASHRSFFLSWDLGILAVILPELSAFLDDAAAEGGVACDPLWSRLQAIDRRIAEGDMPSDAVLLATLLRGPIEECMDGARNPSFAFEEFFDEVATRLIVPKRLKDRMRHMLLVQPRLQAGRIAPYARRDFFADAATLFALDCESRGVPLPAWVTEPRPQLPDDDRDRPRRRRRRRRR